MAADDWPEHDKSDLIARMSQQMRKATEENPLLKQYKSKKTVAKAVKAANQGAKSDMQDVRLQFNLELARVYQPATHMKAVVDCRKLIERYVGNR